MKDLELISENETIAERIVKSDPFKVPYFVRDPIMVREDAITMDLPTDGSVEIEVNPKAEKGLKAKRFLELVESGEKDWVAAPKMGTSLREITESVPDIRARVQDLLEKKSFNNVVRKEMVRAALNHMLMENYDGNLKQQKVAISAAKEIARDPDVGLNVPPSTASVIIDMSTLGKLRTNLQPIPGLETILDV